MSDVTVKSADGTLVRVPEEKVKDYLKAQKRKSDSKNNLKK